jgi:predicted ATPase
VMILEELKIEGFRSLKSVTWRPGRLNALIGPNGGGKSNLLGALELLQIAGGPDLLKAVLRMGGMGALVWDGQAKVIKVEAKADELSPYRLELRRLGNSGGAQISRNSPQNFEEFFEDYAKEWSIHHDVRSDRDSELRAATVTREEKRVEPDGQNLIAVLHTLYENDRNFEEFLDKAMSAAFPDDYEKLVFPPEADGRTQLRVRRKHRKRADSSADLSDGTLRFLLLMTILGSPDPAPLIAIDEPETGLHPRMMSIVAEVAENAARKSQIIFSTHSPSFLDAFDDEPPTTTIVTMEGSETVLKTIAGEELKRWIEDYSLSKFVFSGEADAVL